MTSARWALTATAARLCLLASLPALTGNSGWAAVGEVVTAAVAPAGPVLAAQQRTTLLVATGESVELTCRVLHLGDKSVSWVRSRDLQILAHGGTTFTADERVSATAQQQQQQQQQQQRPEEAVFVLRISRLRKTDGGRYECQVNTDPKLSLFFNITVLDEEMPRVEVTARRDVERGVTGGAATLTCEARYRPKPRDLPVPALALTWRRREQDAQTLQSTRGGVSLETERWERARVETRLTLSGLRAADAGVYECVAAGRAAAVTLLVDDDAGEDAVETMQRDQSALSGTAGPIRASLVSVLTALTLTALTLTALTLTALGAR